MMIPAELMPILERAQVTPKGIQLVEQLDRPTYERIAATLNAAGWKWQRQAKAFTHPVADPGEAIDTMLTTGRVICLADFGFFETTGRALDRVFELADIRGRMKTLEPSAGRGMMAARAVLNGADVYAYEILPDNARAMDNLMPAGHLVVGDFLKADPAPIFDRVVMNPPFAKQADLEHVWHAAQFLKPGGRLVSVMAAGVRFRQNTRTALFHSRIAAFSPQWENLPEGSFKASGTSVSTCILTLERPS